MLLVTDFIYNNETKCFTTTIKKLSGRMEIGDSGFKIINPKTNKIAEFEINDYDVDIVEGIINRANFTCINIPNVTAIIFNS